MIREINYGDSFEMREVYLLLVNAIPHAKQDIANALSLLKNQDEMYQQIKNSDLMDSKLFGFFEETNLIAVCGLYSLEEDCEDTEWVNWFAVDKKFRNKGVARKMFIFLESEVKKKNKLFLKIYTTLPEKISFWLRFAKYDYEEVDDKIRYYFFKKEIETEK